MSDDLQKSIDELNNMLKYYTPQQMVEPHEVEEDIKVSNTLENLATVRISDGGMTAWICIKEPSDKSVRFSKNEIINFLAANKVVKGLHSSNLSAIAKKGVFGREIIVAKGHETVDGKDGYYEFFFDASSKKSPTIREDGTCDYSSMSALSTVDAGQKIAVYHHAEEGTAGFDVTGKESKLKPCKELLPLKGRGIDNSKDADVYYATVAGKIEYRERDRFIDIKNVYEVKGDVDLVTAKIEFFGDIHISGNVEAGVVVRASRNVTIDGVVEAATIYAGGDIVIKRGVQGGQKGRIVSKGNVSADFIEHCYVEAEGDVRSNSFINAIVKSGGRVYADGDNGLILGGSVHGLLGVTAQYIGNDVGTKTSVISGYSGEDYARYLEVFQEESDAQKNLAEVVERMTTILKDKRLGRDKNPEATDIEILELNARKDEFFEKLDNARNEKEKLSDIIERGKGSEVVANEKIYEGVTLYVEGNSFPVPADTSFMKYRNEGGRIVTSVIVK